MAAMDDFITVGTQMKIERLAAPAPSRRTKAKALGHPAQCSFRRTDDLNAYLALREDVFQFAQRRVGVRHGELMENNTLLVPSGYTTDRGPDCQRAAAEDDITTLPLLECPANMPDDARPRQATTMRPVRWPATHGIRGCVAKR